MTNDGEEVIGRVHSYSPHVLLTLTSTPETDSQSPALSSSIPASNPNYTKNTTFIAISASFVKSIQALDKDKPRAKISINEKFANRLNAPSYIPPESLGSNIRKGSRDIKKQEIEFKLLRMSNGKDMSNDGKKVLKYLGNILPIDSLSVDTAGNITFQDSAIKVLKPYKVSNVKVINGNDSNSEETQFEYIKKLVEKSWEKIEQTEKGG